LSQEGCRYGQREWQTLDKTSCRGRITSVAAAVSAFQPKFASIGLTARVPIDEAALAITIIAFNPAEKASN